MKLFGYEIRKIPTRNPGFVKQKDLYLICPTCGRLTKIRQLPDGRTLLAALWDMEKLNRLELGCPCGASVVILSKEAIFEKVEHEEWERIAEKSLKQ